MLRDWEDVVGLEPPQVALVEQLLASLDHLAPQVARVNAMVAMQMLNRAQRQPMMRMLQMETASWRGRSRGRLRAPGRSTHACGTDVGQGRGPRVDNTHSPAARSGGGTGRPGWWRRRGRHIIVTIDLALLLLEVVQLLLHRVGCSSLRLPARRFPHDALREAQSTLALGLGWRSEGLQKLPQLRDVNRAAFVFIVLVEEQIYLLRRPGGAR